MSWNAVRASFTADEVSDGLPVLPPTRGRAEVLLEYGRWQPSDVIGEVPPRNGLLTYEVAAANAAMTGCSPAQFWIVTEAMKAMFEPQFNLLGVQTTTHPVGPCVLVSGPAARDAGIHGGSGCFGPGWAGNARIGRAIRLILMNVGGARPGEFDRATLGSPAKWTFCFTDQAITGRDGTRWLTVAEEVTGSADKSVIGTFLAEGPHNVNDHYSNTANGVLQMVAHSLANVGSNDSHHPGSNPLIVLGPEHATTVASDGFSKKDAREHIAENAHIPLARWSEENRQGRFRDRWPEIYGVADEPHEIFVAEADDLILTVAGGDGKHSMIVPSFGLGQAVVREMAEPGR